MSQDIKTNIKQKSVWKRGLYMLLFAIFYGVAKMVLFVVVVFQFLLKLISGNTNEQLLELGQSVATYMYQILRYLSFNSEYQPYPFGDWPEGEPRPEGNSKELDKVLDKSEQDVDFDGD